MHCVCKLFHSFFELGTLCLISRLTKKGKHILLIRLNAGLVKGVDVQHITGYCASKLKEIHEVAEGICAPVLKLQNDIGNRTVGMSKQCSEHCRLINVIKLLACKEIESVNVSIIMGNFKGCAIILYTDNGFKEIALSILNILTE